MQMTLEANPERPNDELQRALTAAILGESTAPLMGLCREQLSDPTRADHRSRDGPRRRTRRLRWKHRA